MVIIWMFALVEYPCLRSKGDGRISELNRSYFESKARKISKFSIIILVFSAFALLLTTVSKIN